MTCSPRCRDTVSGSLCSGTKQVTDAWLLLPGNQLLLMISLSSFLSLSRYHIPNKPHTSSTLTMIKFSHMIERQLRFTMRSLTDLYHRIFPLYRPNLPLLARLALFHLVLCGVLSGVLLLGGLLQYVLLGDAEIPALRLNGPMNIFGTFMDWIDFLDIFEWYETRDDLLEFDWSIHMALCAISGWVTWKMVGKKLFETQQEE